MFSGRWLRMRSRSSRSTPRIISSYTRVSSAGTAVPSSCPAPASPARRRSCRRGSRQVRRTTPMSSRCSTAPDECIHSPVRCRFEIVLDGVHPPRAGRSAGCNDRNDAAAGRTRPRDLVPRRRPLAAAPLDCGPGAAGADAKHRRRAREPCALDADSEAGGQRRHGARRCARRGSPDGFRGSQRRPPANAVRVARMPGAI